MVMDSVTEGSWLSTSAIRSQIRANPSNRVDVDVPALVEPLDDFFADQKNFSCFGHVAGKILQST